MPPPLPLSPPRTLLLYAQDNRGLGHVTRALTIASRVLAAYPDLVAYIATKSALGGFTLPERCDYIKLPARVPRPGDADDPAERQRFRDIRSRLLLETAQGLAPDLVLVDHEPLGSAGEFREGLYALKARHPATRFVFGLRDIMDDPDTTCAQWRELGVYEALAGLYDGIAVFGSPALYDVAAAYAIPPAVRPKLHYCGYIARQCADAGGQRAAMRRELGVPDAASLVLATAGSGSDGYAVLDAAVAAVSRLQARRSDVRAVVVTGPFMPATQRAALERRATPTCRVVPRADTLRLLAAADAVVSMGGYNSVCEALALGRPLVVVPRATHKVEQAIRAALLAERGIAQCVHPQDLDTARLADALEWALGCDRAAHARRVREIIPSFDGANELTAYLARWLGGD